MNRIVLALAHADHAAYAAGGTDLLDLRASVLVGTLHCNEACCGNQLYQALGAGLGAKSAAHALGTVDFSHSVVHFDGIVVTGCHTGAVAKASVLAVCYVEAGKNCASAVLDSDVIGLVARHIAAALALYESDLPDSCICAYAHDGTDLVGHALASDRTASGRSLSLCDCGSHGIAACIAACTAVVARKALADCSLTGIDIDMELLSGIDQGDSHDQTYYCNDGGGNDNRTHAYPLRN
jgi:hypothetical protein